MIKLGKERGYLVLRWVKTAIITVIVLAIIPTIIMAINKLSGGSSKYVKYEITITSDNINETVYELYNLVKLDEENYVTNLLYVESDGEILNVISFSYIETLNRFWIEYLKGGQTRGIMLDLDNPVNSTLPSDVKIVLYDEIFVELPVSPTELILISLIPLILVSSLLVYQYKELRLKK